MTYLSQNFDVQSVFEFLRIAASEPDNKEAMRESYWIIVFIYLRKIAWDISESFLSEKTKQMLQNVNPFDFNFVQGQLVHEKTQKKVMWYNHSTYLYLDRSGSIHADRFGRIEIKE